MARSKIVKAARSVRQDTPKPALALARDPGVLTAALLMLAALFTAFIIYWPALAGEFVFDDRTLPVFYPNAVDIPLGRWLGIRPLLMASYYVNFHLSGLETQPYHAVNIALHALSSVFFFFVLYRILTLAGTDRARRFTVALFGSALFLVHPLQTEAVTYISSRSETMSVLFFLSAFTVFLYRTRMEVTFKTAAAILAIYLCAMTCKEHTAVLPAALLLTDYFWNPGFSFVGMRRNWKLYLPVAAGGVAGLIFFSTYINANSNAGFALKDFAWYQYLFTQFRAIFIYFRLLILPYGQNADYDFPISHTLFQKGAIYYGIALAALTVAAFIYRKRFPLACYGFFLTLILLAPTSSFVPIHDPLVERRMYLPFLGFVLILSELLVRLPLGKPQYRVTIKSALVVICVGFAVLTWKRNTVWISMDSLWRDTLVHNPLNARALTGLGDSYAMQGHCAEAIPYFDRAARIHPDYRNVFNLASAHDCANDPDGALVGYQASLQIQQTPGAWVHIAMVQMKKGQLPAAKVSLDRAQKLDPGFTLLYVYRGILELAESRFDEAAVQFHDALELEPGNALAIRGTDRAFKHERQF